MNLDDFGANSTPEAPTFQKRGRILVRTKERTRTAGWWGVCPERGRRAFVSERDSGDHRLRNLAADRGGSYAISEDALTKMEMMGIGPVFIVEEDTDRVLEWHIRDFTESGGIVPDSFLGHDSDDGQRFVPVDSARYEWDRKQPDGSERFFLVRGEGVDDPGAEPRATDEPDPDAGGD